MTAGPGETGSQPRYVDSATLKRSLKQLRGSANHLLKLWLTFKQMGLNAESSLTLDTSNSTEALTRLFSHGDPDGSFFVPFAGTPRFMEMKHDASRSIIQTTAKRWADSGSVVTCDPTAFLEFRMTPEQTVRVKVTRQYPQSLGFDTNGFANEGESLAVPLLAFAVWYGKTTPIPASSNAAEFLVGDMREGLHLSQEEIALVFSSRVPVDITLQANPLTAEEIYAMTSAALGGRDDRMSQVLVETHEAYSRRASLMTGSTTGPAWRRRTGEPLLIDTLANGAKAVLLYGPPRTGKTHALDKHVARTDPARVTIQVHDGWGYQQLIMGLLPQRDGSWVWTPGALTSAIREGKTFIVLEEVNRTQASQALGEVFSLIEEGYRGPDNAIELPDGSTFWIPAETTICMTMNTIDTSTEDLDDALLGRLSAIEFPPDPAALVAMLSSRGVDADIVDGLKAVYQAVQTAYPLGHAYFASLSSDTTNADVLRHYVVRIRPLLASALGEFQAEELDQIDNVVDEHFGQ